MTRFEKEINGMLGDFWVKDAKKRVVDAVKQADAAAIVEPDGAIKWKSNGQYLMDDFCEMLEYAGYDFSRQATAKKRDEQVEVELTDYRNNYREPDEFEKAEMRSVFGNDAKLRDVITGEEISLH